MALTSALINYRRVGPGQLYLIPAPTTGITTEEDYYKLFFGSTGVMAAAKKVLTAGLKPYVNIDNGGLGLKIKPSTVKFDPNNGPATDLVTGIESATAELTAFDVDPAHLVDMFGSQAADLITVAAATGVAARQIGLLGPQSWNIPYCGLYRMPSQNVPGEFFHYLFCNMLLNADLDLKMSKKDEMKAKLTLQLMCSPYLMNSAGFGVVVITDDPTAPAL
jgi:hypothetical protein